MIEKIVKRDGRVVPFNPEKITNAIYKAMLATGEQDLKLAKRLSQKVINKLEKSLKKEEIPTVEQVQDIVEQVLIEEGLARVAKAYILYRQKRAEIRKEKQQILGKKEIDEVDKRFDINALRVLASRYLSRDRTGKIVESPKQLFERVAVHTTIPSILYDSRVYSLKRLNKKQKEEKINPEALEGKLKIGRYTLNRYHIEGLIRVYSRLNSERKMKKRLSQIIEMIKSGEFDSYEEEINQYYNLMTHKKFMPNTPVLVNFGNPLGMGMACFVLDMEDSIESIMETLKRAALIFKAGGGCGYNFSKLRPKGDYISTTHGKSSGPIAFMTLYDKMTDVIKQGGVRRGANMGILNSDHPDVEEFIVAKKGNRQLTNFNISVFLKEDFWDYYRENRPYPLINPRDGKVWKYINPRSFFDLIVYEGWESAEPGLLFDDNINRYNPLIKAFGKIYATNPCGEVVLYPNESCDLGSLNLWAFIKEEFSQEGRKVYFDWEEFERAIRVATRFLDNVLDVNKYPFPEIEKMTLKNRKIGLGIMGLADMLFELELPYNSEEGRKMMERVMEFVNYYSKEESIKLARERGRFPTYRKSFYPEGKMPIRGFEERESWHLDWEKLVKKIKKYGLRNAFTTVVAPTGSISMIAGTSSGMEPVFSLVYEKKVTVGTFYYVDPVFEKTMEREGLFDDSLIKEVSKREGSIQQIKYIPDKWKKIFVTALDISAEDHVRALASVQKWTDSSVSKTINFPENATVEDMKKAYLLAHSLGCKGLTVYRYKSIKGVYIAGAEEEEKKTELTSLKDVKAKGPTIYKEAGIKSEIRETEETTGEKCPVCGSPLINIEGCKKCPVCGWSVCEI
ncbi:adenosylcobalamin-dependent ribonucleoside-diphosphate reductase [Persephonella atlantica]|uniref:Vitamin B12-dependent ribonucleotide reductase n=1 Tax=Persephonella atlantica TaxID=2699429 RepID=A0ABS1GG76_9AQUI|nr:adenosylcobalamin-dependent ribonucleoside-diphosphate reductase [Persephonella atlantica]MBK3331871.1 adenosylcobalamin-dependent ribonucleoside-diphosphate reductase [Persephonella atlantica]